MRIVAPQTITTAALASISVPEAAPAAYAAGTTYALDARVSVATGTRRDVYESLQAANLGNTPASSPTWWALVAVTYVEWSSATTYALGDIVIQAATHRMFESLQAANLNHSPTELLSTWWIDIGPTNAWAMFDQVNGTATAAQSEIAFTVQTTGRVDSVALLSLAGAQVVVSATYGGNSVYNETYSLVDNTGVTDWYAYFFTPPLRRTDLIVSDLPLYAGMVVSVALTGEGAVSIGSAIIGLSQALGTSIYGARVGITDFSRKEADAFGNYQLVERPFSKRGNFSVVVDGFSVMEVASKVDAIQRILAGYRATPLVFVASDSYDATAIFGFYRSFDLDIAYPTQSVLTLEIEGLT